MVESCEETIALEESVEKPRKLEETVGKTEEIVGRKFWKDP